MFNSPKQPQSAELADEQGLQPVLTQAVQSFENSAILTQDLEHEIRVRAYELYEARGRQDGYHEQDWQQAETEILTREAKRNPAQAA